MFLPFTTEWIDSLWFSCIFVYFFKCHSLLKWCLQNGQSVESAWCSPLQLEHLNECRQGSPFFVSNLGELVFSLALQHHVLVVNSLIKTIALNTFCLLDSANSSQMPPFPTIFALWYSRIHICSPNCYDETTNVKSSVNETFGLWAALRVPYIDLNDWHVWLGRDFDDSRFWG